MTGKIQKDKHYSDLTSQNNMLLNPEVVVMVA